MAKSYQMLYKCRLCGQVFANYGTVSEKVAEQSTLNEVLRASGMSPMWKENDSRNLCEEVSDEIADIAGEKLDRWRNRLLARPLAKTIEVKEDKKDG